MLVEKSQVFSNREEENFKCSSYGEVGVEFVNKVAYCVFARIRTSKNTGQPYAIFNLKDANGVSFTAYIFNLINNKEVNAISVVSMRNSFVKFTGEVGEYNGSRTYYLYEIVKTTSVNNLEDFLGRETQAESFLNKMIEEQKTLGLPKESYADIQWELSSISMIDSGRIGGYSKFSHFVWNYVKTFLNFNPNEKDYIEFGLTVTSYVLHRLFRIYKNSSMLDFTPTYKLLQQINGNLDENLEVFIQDSLMGILDAHKPETIIGSAIVDAVSSYRRNLELLDIKNSILIGHTYSSSKNDIKWNL